MKSHPKATVRCEVRFRLKWLGRAGSPQPLQDDIRWRNGTSWISRCKDPAQEDRRVEALLHASLNALHKDLFLWCVARGLLPGLPSLYRSQEQAPLTPCSRSIWRRCWF